MKDQYKDALKYMNKLYTEGLLDNQTFTQDTTQFDAALNNDDHLVGLYADGGVNADGDNFWAKKPGDWQNWACLEPVAGPDGVRLAARGITTYFGSSIGSISANCKYPVIAAALFDFLASEEASNVQAYGPEGFGWDWTTEGTSLGDGTPKYVTHTIPDDYDWIGNGFPKNYAHKAYAADAMLRSSSVDFRSALKIDNPDVDVEYVFQKAAEKYEKYSPDVNTLIPNLAFEEEDSQAISEYTLTIGGFVNQATVQFITGNMDIDKEWGNYISKLKDMGVDDYIARYQKCYDAYMKAAGK
jgi:putative aldouronate transport system substrate-binding protein